MWAGEYKSSFCLAARMTTAVPGCPINPSTVNGRRYIDWSARIDSLGEARAVAELWVEIIQCYLSDRLQVVNSDTATEDPVARKQLRPDAAWLTASPPQV